MILIEQHIVDCTCSYCKGEHALRYGLNVPAARNRKAWWTVKLSKRWYVRVSLSSLRSLLTVRVNRQGRVIAQRGEINIHQGSRRSEAVKMSAGCNMSPMTAKDEWPEVIE